MPAKNSKSVHEAIVKALQTWVQQHPNPDVPALSIATCGQFSPRQLLQEVCERSDTGFFFEEMIEAAVVTEQMKFEDILRWFEGSTSVASNWA